MERIPSASRSFSASTVMVCGTNQLLRSNTRVVPVSSPFSDTLLPPALTSDSRDAAAFAVMYTFSVGGLVSTTV